jgi:hypothetical protein
MFGLLLTRGKPPRMPQLKHAHKATGELWNKTEIVLVFANSLLISSVQTVFIRGQ